MVDLLRIQREESLKEKKNRILLVEDNLNMAEPLKKGLEEEGFFIRHVTLGAEAIRALNEPWQLVILDLTLPDLPGESVLSNLKQKPDYPPVLILTARSKVEDKVGLFRQGCDDYLTKPFVFEELLGRVQALIRRSHRVLPNKTSLLDLELDPKSHTLSRGELSVQLTPKESLLIHFLIGVEGRIVSRKELLQYGWGLAEEPETNFIGVYLFNLRKKLSEVGCGDWLLTLRGTGYRFYDPKEKP